MFYLGDKIAEDDEDILTPFQSIDSQTDHVQLSNRYEFALPSQHFTLGSKAGDGRIAGSSVHSACLPGSYSYNKEIEDLFATFNCAYQRAAEELVRVADRD